MPGLDDIRDGLAANLAALKTAGVVKQVSTFLLDEPSPPSIQIAGVDEIDYDTTFRRGGDSWTILVEAALGTTSDKAASQLLDRLLAPTGSESVKTVIESDKQLTSRYNQTTGVVTDDQPAACADLRVARYRGQTRFRFPKSGTEMLLATWEVVVET